MSEIKELLRNLNFDEEHGLIILDDKEKWINKLNHHTYKTIEALSILKPYALFEFNNAPFILFFDHPTDEQEKDLYNQIWCFNQAPIVFVIKNNQTIIYNAFKYIKKENRLEKIQFPNKEFDFWKVQSGNTWNLLRDKLYRRSGTDDNFKKSRVDQSLINNIEYASSMLKQKGLNEELANLLILRLIFTRYLIDRKVKFTKYLISEDQKKNKKELPEIIKDINKLYGLFAYLRKRFSGTLFELIDKESTLIKKHHHALSTLAQLFSEEIDFSTDQIILFNDYDFRIIPVEFISSIYESIIRKKEEDENASIYTPPFLVDYILSETIKPHLEDRNDSNCKVLDPSCGSGIFLVETYRKIVEKEAKLLNKKTNQLGKELLINLLEKNIFGVDKNKNALHVSCFSLYVALLDYKEPKEIDDISLPRLIGKNLFSRDFFDTKHKFNEILLEKNIDFVIGNPPWKKFKGSHVEYCFKRENREKSDIQLDHYEIAEAFLIRVSDIAPYARFCLIVTSKILYNKSSKSFRKYFLNQYAINKVVDLSPVRFLIFENAKCPAAIISYTYKNSKNIKDNIISHISFKPNIYFEYFNTIVIEKYDNKDIKQEYFYNYDWMWKVLLYGNIADFLFIERLMSYPKLIKNIIREYDIENNRGESVKYSKDIKDKLKTNKIKKYYTYHPSINLNTNNHNWKYILIPRRAIKEYEMYVSFCEGDYLLTDTAIVFRGRDRKMMLNLYGLMISNLYTYFQYMTSSDWGVYIPEININEHRNFPFNINNMDVFADMVNNIIKYYRKSFSKTNFMNIEETLPSEYIEEINKHVRLSYDISETEEDLIDYTLNVSRNSFRINLKTQKHLASKATDSQLKSFAMVFYEHFGNIYNGPNEFFQIDIYSIDYFVAMNFKIVDRPPNIKDRIIIKQVEDKEKILSAYAKNTSIYKLTNMIYLQRDVKGFEDDSFYLIKPNEYKCWHKAVARMDLAEFIEQFMKNTAKTNKIKSA